MKRNDRAVAGSGIRMLGAQVAVTMVSLAFTVWLARVLTKNEFATFSVIGIVVNLVGMLSNLGLETSAIRRVPSMSEGDGRDEGVALIKTALLSRCVLSIVLGAAVYLSADRLSELFLKTPDYVGLIRWMALGAASASILNSLQLLSQAAQEFSALSFQVLFANLVQRFLAVVLYLVLGLQGYVIGFSAGPLLGVLGMVWVMRRYLFNRVRPTAWWPVVSYSVPYCMRGYARYGMLQIDEVIIGVLLTPDVLATYSVARRFSTYLKTITDAFLTPATSKVAELSGSGSDRLRRSFERISRYVSLIIVPVCLATALASPTLMELYGGQKYRDGWPILAVLSLGQVAYYVGSVYLTYVFALGRPLDVLVMEVAGGLTNSLAGALLLWLIGSHGVAWAQLLGLCLMAVLGKRILSSMLTVRFDAHVGQVLAIPIACAAIIIVAGQLLSPNLWLTPLYGGASAALFVALAVPRLGQDDWEQIEALSPRRMAGLVQKARQYSQWRPLRMADR